MIMSPKVMATLRARDKIMKLIDKHDRDKITREELDVNIQIIIMVAISEGGVE